MASYIRQKEALRAATYALTAGAHCVTQEVDRMQSLVYTGLDSDSQEVRQARQEMLTDNYERFLNSEEVTEIFVDILNQEELYPFGSQWSAGALRELLLRLIAPDLNFSEEGFEETVETELYADAEGDPFWVEKKVSNGSSKLRFKPGFKKLLNEFAAGLESEKKKPDTVDHWLVQLLNTSFYTGMNIAGQLAENSQPYYAAIQEIDSDEEPWNRYPQIVSIFERQLRRETKKKTGLVDLDY